MSAVVTPPGPPRLELRAITKDFPGVRALDGVSLTLEAGEVHALCGENGAGKSTLLKVLAGAHPGGSYAGELLLFGRRVQFTGLRAAEAHGIALIAQELALVPQLSIAENLLLGREPTRRGWIDRAAERTFAERALARVALALDPETLVRTLGVGQQQLVEIARALAKDAAILVLDEPTAALPARDAGRLFELLAGLRAEGVAILLVSHRLEEVYALADRITVLRDGRTVGSGTPAALPRARVVALMVGRELADAPARAAVAPGPVRLRVRGWTLADPARPSRLALADVDLELRAGEVLGIAGLMGAGRTALAESLFGAARSAVTGTLELGERQARPPFGSPAEAMAAGLALVSEDRKRHGLVPAGSVADNLSLASLARFAPRGWLDEGARRRACAAQVAALQLRPPELDTEVARLSGGNQQKVVIGRWLMRTPGILLLDEPTRGVDVGARAAIHEWIARLAAQGLAVLLVTSDLPELLQLSDRVLVLSHGRRTALLARAAASPEAVMAAATRTVAA